ncbi:MAG: DUF4838 domain-containing protein [Planctomycetes bacterium]|nr:DUF4838 domain-containing protein [Planctomycetota bacterium]
MQSSPLFSALGLMMLPVIFIATGCASVVVVATNGRPQAVIVVAEDAAPAEKHAGQELALFLKQTTGADFEVKSSAADDRSRLLVGPAAARLTDPRFTTDGLGAEGLIIRTTGKDLILAGGRPRGTLYAVYTFLEDHVGCRWWAPGASSIPKKPTLVFDNLDVKYIPPLEYREPFWFSGFDGDWAARNKSNGATPRLEDKHGGKHVIQGFVHTFNGLIPPAKYFNEHPEWFSEIQSKRVQEHSQLCLTNEQMRAELVKNLKDQLRKNPSATMASVSQNDWANNCQCPRCTAVDKEEGSPAGSMIRFVNAVAEEIEKEFPNVAISTLAYQYTRKPPLKVRPRPNVVVWLCSIECSFSKPLIDERNADFRRDIEGWSQICKRLYVWDYTTNFAHYVMPHPNLNVLGPNVKFFANHNVVGLFEQGAYHTNGAEMMELRTWVLAKMLWNPSLNADELIDEFLNGYYGPAAPHVRAYLDTIHQAVAAGGDHLGCFSPLDAKFLSLDTLSAGWKHLQTAEKAAGSDDTLLLRIRTAQLPVLYTFIIQWDRLRKEAADAKHSWPVADTQQAVYEQFMKTAEAIKMTHVAEGRGIDWLKSQVK